MYEVWRVSLGFLDFTLYYSAALWFKQKMCTFWVDISVHEKYRGLTALRIRFMYWHTENESWYNSYKNNLSKKMFHSKNILSFCLEKYILCLKSIYALKKYLFNIKAIFGNYLQLRNVQVHRGRAQGDGAGLRLLRRGRVHQRLAVRGELWLVARPRCSSLIGSRARRPWASSATATATPATPPPPSPSAQPPRCWQPASRGSSADDGIIMYPDHDNL